MPPRFIVLSEPIEAIVADGAQRGWASVLLGWNILREKGNDTVSFVYSDTFSHRFAHVAESALCPGSPLFLLLFLTAGFFFLKVAIVQKRANEMLQKYSHVD